MSKKISVGVLFGGRSCEHEVSVVSARSVLEAIDRDTYDVHLIGIDKSGHWHLADNLEQLLNAREIRELSDYSDQNAALVSMDVHHQGNLIAPNQNRSAPLLDVVFLVLHGTFGEDGTIQGLFEMAGIPYVGCGVAASAVAMDKALAKQIFASAGIPQAPCEIVLRYEWEESRTKIVSHLKQELGFPMFVKPANMGSSVGVNKAGDDAMLLTAIEDAFQYDNKIVVEQSMENCHEVECAVLGNENPIASQVGEIIPGAEFYNYQTKYIDDKSETLIPANISKQATEQVQQLSLRAFQAIGGNGLSRVDFFVHRQTQEVFLNEINTLPGFTPISMYPKMWAASGIAYSELIDRLITLAFEAHGSRQQLKRSV